MPILEASWPEPCRGGGMPSRALPAPNILATPCDCDGVCAGNHGVILEAIDTIAQVLLLHTLFSLCQRQGEASGLLSSGQGLAWPYPSHRPTYWGPSR